MGESEQSLRTSLSSSLPSLNPPKEGPSLPLSIVLATLNERTALPILIERIRQVPLPPYELVIVDDGSTDGTREYLEQLAAVDPRVRILFHTEPRTLIPAQSDGIDAARGDFVVIMDSDLQHPPEKIPELFRRLAAGDGLVLASRYTKSGSTGKRPWTRGIISRGAELILRVVLPETRGISDPMSGFYAFRRNLFRRPEPMHRGYHMLPYMLTICAGASVSEVPYSFGRRLHGTSKITQNLGFIPLFLRQVRITSQIRAYRAGEAAFSATGLPGAVPEGLLPPPFSSPPMGKRTDSEGLRPERLLSRAIEPRMSSDRRDDGFPARQ